MEQRVIIITPEDTIINAPYHDYKDLQTAVGGMIEHLCSQSLPVIPALAYGEETLPVDFFCNEEFLITNDPQFEKVNAIASLISGQEIRGNVVLTVREGEDGSRGFYYTEEDTGGEIEEGLCECWTAEDSLIKYVNHNRDAIKDLHDRLDFHKSEPKYEFYFDKEQERD